MLYEQEYLIIVQIPSLTPVFLCRKLLLFNDLRHQFFTPDGMLEP